MVKKQITIEDLAVMVQRGFEETASKTEINEGFKDVNDRLNAIDQRLDRIENILIAGHDRRIEKLEDSVRQLILASKIK